MRWWKWLGLAALVGVAATGIRLERSRRHWNEYDPDQLRERLHQRLRDADARTATDGSDRGVSTGP